MVDPQEYYSKRVGELQRSMAIQSSRLRVSSVLRLLVFVLTAGAIYWLWENTLAVSVLAVLGLTVFLYLVSRHSDLKQLKAKIVALLHINLREISIAAGDRSMLDSGSRFASLGHAFAHDIDLYGLGSFFQYCTRTELPAGAERLAKLLGENDVIDIKAKQEALIELAAMSEWRQDYCATARLVKTETSPERIRQWVGNYTSFVPSMMRFIPIAFSLLSVLFIFAYAFNFISGLHLCSWFVLGLIITGVFLSKINELSGEVSRAQSTFAEYRKLVEAIEEQDFKSNRLLVERAPIKSETELTSLKLNRFAKMLSALDQRNNMLFGFIANGFLLWDLRCSYAIEQWIYEHGAEVETWFETVHQFDALNSLGTFLFNHPAYIFPELTDDALSVIEASQVHHPLLDPEVVIGNPVNISSGDFQIITGANMAGKSTYLRTVSLLIVMSNVGLPVAAESCLYRPIRLITSMRSTDSLSDDTSYFFSELKRLRYIMDQLESNRYFIILDEILKGTNSTDKAIGSRKFVKRLVQSNSTGIIATHDLSLCDLADELEEVSNYYLDAEIVNNELFFDYLLKEGICSNMNASFLLEKLCLV